MFFAQIDENNIVTNVIVADQDFINTQEGTWIETNTNGLRKNLAGIGYTYDSTRDAFIPPQIYSSHILNEQTCLWEAPIPYPEDGKWYRWDENEINWKLVITE